LQPGETVRRHRALFNERNDSPTKEKFIMSDKKGNSSFNLEIASRFNGLKTNEKPPATHVYAFEEQGGFLASAALEPKSTKLALHGVGAGSIVRLVFAPKPKQETDRPQYSQIVKGAHQEQQVRLNPAATKIDIALPRQIWGGFELLCSCLVRGVVVKQVGQPDGSTLDLPVCNSRVNICEVETLWDLIEDFFDDDVIFLLRDAVLNIINPVVNIPGRTVPPFPPPGPGPLENFRFENTATSALSAAQTTQVSAVLRKERIARLQARAANMPKANVQKAASAPATIDLSSLDAVTRARVNVLSLSQSATEIRANLKEFVPIMIPYLCWWDFLEPWWWLFVDCVQTVYTNPDGSFETTLYYDCDDSLPGLYFTVEQLQNGNWRNIYQPWVACSTNWSYNCGDLITIYITDPAAVACAPSIPVNVPPGVGSFVIPWSVGGTKIWGLGQPMDAPMGWVKKDGRTGYATNGLFDYAAGAGPFLDSPFGATLGFWMLYSPDLPSSTIVYYKYSYSPSGLEDWHDIAAPVYAPYGHVVPEPFPNPPHVTYPSYQLGPFTKGSGTNLFQFRPPNPPPPAPGDPAGTYTYWSDPEWGGQYAAYLDSTALATGDYDIKVECFDGTGAIVMPVVAPLTTGDFFFLLPISDTDTRGAVAGDMDLAGNGLRFKIHVDNNVCAASTDAPAIGITAVADVCGFLRYNPADNVTIAFHATHPNNEARFHFGMIRGIFDVSAADAPLAPAYGADVSVLTAGSYTGDGSGNFSNGFPVATLLGTCTNAAFAESVGVYAKATDGSERLQGYDRSALRAFALATM
jgi:hypothetical protein